MPSKRELCGSRYGRLTVISEAGRKGGSVVWLCRCDCGIDKEITSHDLIRGHAKSCGCLQKDSARTHGHSSKKIYSIYRAMRQRCYDDKSLMYHRYGGRGIKICDEWMDSIDSFITWATNNGYDESKEIDRADNEKGYSPDNCRFVTKIINANNTSKNVIIYVNGEYITIANAARKYKIDESTFRQRIRKLGWSPEKAIRNDIDRSPALSRAKKVIIEILSDGPKSLNDVLIELSKHGYNGQSGSIRRAKSSIGVITKRIGKTQTEWSLPNAYKDAPRLTPSPETLAYIQHQNIRHAKSRKSA